MNELGNFLDVLSGVVDKVIKPIGSVAGFVPGIGTAIQAGTQALSMGVGVAKGVQDKARAKKAAKQAVTQAPSMPGVPAAKKKKKKAKAVATATLEVRPIDSTRAALLFRSTTKPHLDNIGHRLRMQNLQAQITHEHRERMRRENFQRAVLKNKKASA